MATLALSACDDPFAILPARIENRVDTLELFAANGTSLERASGYVIALNSNEVTRGVVRLGIDPPPILNAPPFDFFYRIDPADGPQFVPFGAVTTPSPNQTTAGRSGLQGSTQTFDEISEGQQVGYTVDKPTNLAAGQVLFARSSLPNGCFLGIPYYAKIEVISFDATARSIKFRILANTNCGYRGLQPGLPKR